jgi:hypothetical protein
LLFPPEARARLRALLDAAGRQARSTTVRQRVEFVSAAFAITEAFCEFSESRSSLSRLTLAGRPDPATVIAAAQLVSRNREAVEHGLDSLRKTQPLAIRAKLLEEYTRNDPRRRALWRLWPDLAAVSALPGFAAAFADLSPLLSARSTAGRELAVDGALRRLQLRKVQDFTALDWVKSGSWRGHGEPYDTRQISLVPGLEQGAIRFEGCKQETLSQWHGAEPEADYIGTARVRARVSPGNMTFLIVIFLNDKGEYLGIGSIDRLPVGEWNEPVELAVLVHAPGNVRQVGLGVRVLNQVNDDYAEFSQLSLKRLE